MYYQTSTPKGPEARGDPATPQPTQAKLAGPRRSGERSIFYTTLRDGIRLDCLGAGATIPQDNYEGVMLVTIDQRLADCRLRLILFRVIISVADDIRTLLVSSVDA